MCLGDGTFPKQTVYPTASGPASVAVGDFDSNHQSDIVVANAGNNSISILISHGNGTFHKQRIFSVDSSPCCVITGDFNNDQKLDVALAFTGANKVGILLGPWSRQWNISRREDL